MKTLTELTSAAINIIFLSLASVAITGIFGGIYFVASEIAIF